jgi:hypothetical protein
MAAVRLHFVVTFSLVTFGKALEVKMLYLVKFLIINIYVNFCEKFEGKELQER